MKTKVGIFPLARETFDVPFAESEYKRCQAVLEQTGAEMIGGTQLLFDAESTRTAIESIRSSQPDLLILVQVTFTDAAMAVEIAQNIKVPILLWSLPEERTGGRIRLNSFCGINLAAHALKRIQADYTYIHADPDEPGLVEKINTIAGMITPDPEKKNRVNRAIESLKGTLLVIGEHPPGFDACDYDGAVLKKQFGITVKNLPINDFIDQAKAVPDSTAQKHADERGKVLGGLDQLDQKSLLKSMKIYEALDAVTKENNAFGTAVRCWPHFFTEFGAAACGPIGMMGEKRIPCGCETDVYGVITSKLLSEIGDTEVFNTDLVDVRYSDETFTLWHCGQAPVQMADPDSAPAGTVHTNRKMPLLSQFPLKPGRITMARLTRGGNSVRLFTARAEMIKAPLAYAGTAGVARFDSPLKSVIDTMMTEGLEHHTAMVYGDFSAELRELGKILNLELIEV